MIFASREDAGEKLGLHLTQPLLPAQLVLGLPRGGVVVAAAVARVLSLPLDVIVVRKIGHPRHREFAVGALAEPDVVLLDQEAMEKTGASESQVQPILEEEMARLQEYQARFHPTGRPRLQDQLVLIVDDGLATGATMEAAVLSARGQRARRVVVAAPVASENALARMQKVADDVQALWVDPDFEAVGAYYRSFPQTTDEEVVALLQERREGSP
jgi:putative phosphoribosyl transferase